LSAPHDGIEAAAHAGVFHIEQHLVAVLRGDPCMTWMQRR